MLLLLLLETNYHDEHYEKLGMFVVDDAYGFCTQCLLHVRKYLFKQILLWGAKLYKEYNEWNFIEFFENKMRHSRMELTVA